MSTHIYTLSALALLSLATPSRAFAFGAKPLDPSPPTHTATHTHSHTVTHTTTHTATSTTTHTSTPTATATATLTHTSTATSTQIGTGRASNAGDITVCAQGAALAGVDVSAYDPGTNWATAARGGVGFAYIKATEGDTYVNPLFASDWAATKSAGVLRGAYHFFHPKDDPRTQANEFLKVQGMLGTNDLPAMLDWEVTDRVSNAVQIASAQIWLEEVQAATGKRPVIYVDPSFYNELGNPPEFFAYPLFIAHYDVRCPLVPPPWSKWTFWQKGAGPVTGVAEPKADQDEFNGTATQLLNFAQKGVLP